MRRLLFLCFALAFSQSAFAQIYRWTDANGQVNFSNSPPPPGVKATVVDPNAKDAPPAPPAAEGAECYTIRCQGERMEERQRRREAELEKEVAQRAAAAPKGYRGLEFRKYISIQRGMTEGELLGIAGEPDLMADQGVAVTAPMSVQGTRNAVVAARAGLAMKTYTYMPTSADPYTTTITLVGGRVSEIERAHKF